GRGSIPRHEDRDAGYGRWAPGRRAHRVSSSRRGHGQLPAALSRRGRKAMVLDPGSPFGRYRILTRLGVGGMASVYHAFQAEPRREVALKIISPELAAQPAFRARFRREADVLAHL